MLFLSSSVNNFVLLPVFGEIVFAEIARHVEFVLWPRQPPTKVPIKVPTTAFNVKKCPGIRIRASWWVCARSSVDLGVPNGTFCHIATLYLNFE